MIKYHPWRELDALPGVRVVIEEIDDCWGYYDEWDNTIHLDSRLSQAERRCTLAHELIHAQHADIGNLNDWHHNKRERSTCLSAARKLVPIDALADVLVWTTDEFEVAEVLWVDVDTIRTRLTNLTQDETALITDRIDRDIRGIA